MVAERLATSYSRGGAPAVCILGRAATLLSEPQWDVTARLVGASTAALMLWLLLSGLMGLFIRYLDRPNQIYRYLSDASYSLYLLHLPMVVWVGGLVAGTALPAGIKYLSSSSAFPLCS
jgi:peptidoglycan/LPS O-acetylase OafA/YrhL